MIFRLVAEQAPVLVATGTWPTYRCFRCGDAVMIREYPDLVPPAEFMDCVRCARTWETSRDG